jgi:hypothetical protein
MGLRVTFDIFSGRPNPSVTFEGKQATELSQRLQPAAKATTTAVAAASRPRLGYRGLVIEQVGSARNSKVAARSVVADGLVLAGGAAHRAVDAGVEAYALEQASAVDGGQMPADLASALLGDLQARKSERKARAATSASASPLVCRCAPLYEPAWWNDGGQRQQRNNCYNYACNYRTDSFAQPGRAGGNRITDMSCKGVRPRALEDALLDYSGKQIKCPPEGHLVALAMWTRWDFHWYRMGRDGRWSHKPGNWAVTDLDNAGQPILDPRTADRGRYTDFCCFMVVMQGHVRIS